MPESAWEIVVPLAMPGNAIELGRPGIDVGTGTSARVVLISTTAPPVMLMAPPATAKLADRPAYSAKLSDVR